MSISYSKICQSVNLKSSQFIAQSNTLNVILLLVGYDISVAEKALIATKNKGIQPAIDW